MSGAGRLRVFLIAGLLLAPLAIFGFSSDSSAIDVTHEDDIELSNVVIPIEGNLTIEPGADVVMRDALIFMKSDVPGKVHVWVKAGGSLRLVHSVIQGDPAAFELIVDGVLRLEESEIRPLHRFVVGDVAAGTQGDEDQMRNFTAPASRMSAAWSGKDAWVFGGLTSPPGALSSIHRYTPSNNTIQNTGARLPTARYGTSALWYAGTASAYVFGGFTNVPPEGPNPAYTFTDQVIRYEPAKNAVYAMGATLPTPRGGMTAVAAGEAFYIFGGRTETGTTNEILRYYPKNDTLTKMQATLPTALQDASAVWDGSYAYVFGGQTGSLVHDSVVRYSPAKDEVTVLPVKLPQARTAAVAVWDPPYAYIMGGRNGTGPSSGILTSIARFDPEKGTAIDVPVALGLGPGLGHMHPAAIRDGTTTYLFGGYGPFIDPNFPIDPIHPEWNAFDVNNHTRAINPAPTQLIATKSTIIEVSGTTKVAPSTRTFSLTDTTLNFKNPDPVDHVIDGARASLLRGEVLATRHGLTATNSAILSLDGVKMQVGDIGLMCRSDASINAARSVLNSTEGSAIVANGLGETVKPCTVTLSDTRVTGGGTRGAQAILVLRSVLKAANGTIDAPRGMGVFLQDLATANLTSVAMRTRSESIAVIGSTLDSASLTLTSVSSPALRCQSSTLRNHAGGTWTSDQSWALGADDCDGLVRGARLSSRLASAAHWFATPPRSFLFDGVSVARAGTPALDLRGLGEIRGGDGTGFPKFVQWSQAFRTGPDPPARITNLQTSSSSECLLCLTDGYFRIVSTNATGPSTVAVKAAKAELSIEGGLIHQAKTGLHLTDSAATAFGTVMKPENNTLLRSSIQSRVLLTPVVRLKNNVAVPGATVTIRSLDGTQLAQGTSNAQGKGPGVDIEAFRQQDGVPLAKGPDVRVTATHPANSTTTTISPLAADFDVILWDHTPPKDVKGLKMVTPPNTSRVTASWNATTDNWAAPSYRLSLALNGGRTQVLRGAQFVNFTGGVIANTADTTHTFDLLGQGDFSLSVQAVDASGNRGNTTRLNVLWDQSNPTLRIQATGKEGAEGWFLGDVSARVVAEDLVSSIQSVRLNLNGVPVANATRPISLTADGVYDFEASTTDTVNNGASATLRVRLDKSAPTVPVPGTTRSVFKELTRVVIAWEGEPTDRFSGIQELNLVRERDGEAPETLNRFRAPFPTEASVDLKVGGYDYALVAVDRAGNEARSRAVRLIVDSNPPTLAAGHPTKLPLDQPSLVVRVEDESRIVDTRVFVDDDLWASAPGGEVPVDLAPAGQGVHTLRVVATDEGGNSMDVSFQVTVGEAKKSPSYTAAGVLMSALLLVAFIRRQRPPQQEGQRS